MSATGPGVSRLMLVIDQSLAFLCRPCLLRVVIVCCSGYKIEIGQKGYLGTLEMILERAYSVGYTFFVHTPVVNSCLGNLRLTLDMPYCDIIMHLHPTWP